jgi:hypothetical protein
MNRSVFYDAVRTSLFAGKLSHSQVEGMDNLLDVWEQHFANDTSIPNPTDHLAYDLGTTFHETARSMQPITEYGEHAYFDKYEPASSSAIPSGATATGFAARAMCRTPAGAMHRRRRCGSTNSTTSASTWSPTRRSAAIPSYLR